MDDQWTMGTGDATREFVEALMGQYGTTAVKAASGSKAELVRGFFDGTIGNFQTRAEKNLDASRELVEQARRGQEAGWVLARESANAYADFLDSIFFCYRESVRVAEGPSSFREASDEGRPGPRTEAGPA